MRLAISRLGVIRGSVAGIFGVVLAWPGISASAEQGPSLPGAVTTPPAWLVPNAPFDVVQFFDAPPSAKNAAPLYLDALFEFSPEVQGCFSKGPGRDQRTQAARDRVKRFDEIQQAISKDPKSLTDDALGGAIQPFDEGFRKLAEAQRRPRCVFQPGIDFTALIPHAQSARQVARVANLRVRRAVARKDFTAAIEDVKTTLRLARDLRPRGVMISQLVADAISGVVMTEIVPTILAAPGLRAEDCDRLLSVLTEYEARSIDGYTEGLKGEYIGGRATLYKMVHDQKALAATLGLKPGDSIIKSIVAGSTITSVLYNATPTNPKRTPRPGASSQPQTPEPWPADVDAQVARTTPEEMARRVGELTACYRDILATAKLPVDQRLAKIDAIQKREWARPDGLLGRLLNTMLPALEAFAQAEGRTLAALRATECLVALRRWELAHHEGPHDLAAALKEAGQKAVPTDPYDGKPLGFVEVDGRPVVYSIGKDGRDDGGRVDSENDRHVGDLMFRLPELPRP